MSTLLFIAAAVLFLCAGLIYKRTSRVLASLDKMLEAAIDGTFSENYFSEDQLSKLETKLFQYLQAGSTEKKQLTAQKETAEMLVSNISHQTKTPIAAILLYSQLLKEQKLSEEAGKLAAQIELQAEKLNFLVQALVKLSRLENGTITPVPKQGRVRELLERLKFPSAVKEKGITITVLDLQADTTAFFDRKWTEEALDNILDNAVKYTPPKGNITVSALEYEMFVRINIADTGMGIAEEETAKIFLRFYRSPAASEEKGVGIGLYLAREIIEAEGGYIKVASEPGKGSVFSIFLPKQPILSKL